MHRSWLRALTEIVVLPFLTDGRFARSVWAWVQTGLTRLAGRSRESAVLVALPEISPPAAVPAQEPVDTPSPVHEVDDQVGLVADNRAGRRAAQRQEAQAKKARPPR